MSILCRFCDGRDVHQCPGGWTRGSRSENAFSLNSVCEERVFPGMLDARAYPREQIDAQLEAMFAYELAGSEEGALELLAKASGCATTCMTCGADVPDLGPLKTSYFCQACIASKCKQCGALDCTKNHAEFM